MAKTNTTPSPAKGKATAKAKASATPDPPLRRSPRKRMNCANTLEAEAAAKVTKRATPPKKATPVKKLASALAKRANARKAAKLVADSASASASPSPKKATTARAKPPAAAKNASPAARKTGVAAKLTAIKKTASSSPVKAATAATKRLGRPRKDASPAVTNPMTALPRPRGRPPKDGFPAKVIKPEAAPTKKVRTRASENAPTSPRPSRVSPANPERRGDLTELSSYSSESSHSEDSVELNHELLELAEQSVQGSPKKALTTRKASTPSSKGRGSSASHRRKSLATVLVSKAARQSLTKASKSSRKTSAAALLGGSPRNGPRHSNLDFPDMDARVELNSEMQEFERRSTPPFKPIQSSKTSPARIDHSHIIEVDPGTGMEYEVEERSRLWNNVPHEVHSPAGRIREAVGGHKKTGYKRSPRVQDPKADRPKSPLQKAKPKSSIKNAALKSLVKKAATSLKRTTPNVPPARSPTKPARKTSWDNKFNAADEYGRTLRTLEMKAYTAQKEGKTFHGVSPHIEEEDGVKARQQGVDRAKAEFAMRTLADAREQRVREGYEERGVDLEAGEEYSKGAKKGSRARSKPPSRQASVSHQRPSPPPPSPAYPSSRRSSSTTRSPRRKLSKTTDEAETFTPLSPGQPSASNRGTIHSITNPELISGTNKPNPFFETMPGPEYWHRNQPAYFMFGETPFMQREISRQINEDLRKGAGASGQELERHRKPSFGDALANLFGWNRSQSESVSAEQVWREGKLPFALPEVADEDVYALFQKMAPMGGKRKASSSASLGRSLRRPRRVSGGSGSGSPERRMSGALQ